MPAYIGIGEVEIVVVHSYYAGLEVPKKTVVATLLILGKSGGVYREIYTSHTRAADRLDCRSGRQAMHKPIYWKKFYNYLVQIINDCTIALKNSLRRKLSFWQMQF